MERNDNIELLPRVVACVDCGEPFVISSGERAFYLKKYLKEPVRCSACRKRRKAAETTTNVHKCKSAEVEK
jgi:hypothetical protein